MVLRPPVHERSGADHLRLGGELSAAPRCVPGQQTPEAQRDPGQVRRRCWVSSLKGSIWRARHGASGTARIRHQNRVITTIISCRPCGHGDRGLRKYRYVLTP